MNNVKRCHTFYADISLPKLSSPSASFQLWSDLIYQRERVQERRKGSVLHNFKSACCWNIDDKGVGLPTPNFRHP
jgi:hypothetical protein